MEYTTIVAAPASRPAGFKYIAPYTGSAIGQHWMYEGKHVLIVFDDLSKQAEAYRAVSLLLRRPPGREAYPATSSTCTPACWSAARSSPTSSARLDDRSAAGRDQGQRRVGYIPTNVISITDGQIFLETGLFNSGVRRPSTSASRCPASVARPRSRPCGRSRPPALDLAQFRELEAFASFSSDLDASSRATLDRGQRLVELLKQGQYSPFPVEREVVSLWLGTTGKLDVVPVGDVRRFEAEFLDFVARGDNGIFDEIRSPRSSATTPCRAWRRPSRRSTASSRPARASRSRSTSPRPRRWTPRSVARSASRSRRRPDPWPALSARCGAASAPRSRRRRSSRRRS
jgi:F-type H+-transporting ATPase subunit alpha